MIIKTNGSHLLPKPYSGIGGAKSIVKVSGVSGTATAKFTYKNEEGTQVDLTDGAITFPGQFEVVHGSAQEGNSTDQIYITVATADGSTNIVVDIASVS